MINLINGEVNTAVFTLDELTSLKNCHYLFEFKNILTNELIYFTCPDISMYKNRYNKFIITLINDINQIDLMNGIIKVLSNRHAYNIYDTDILDTEDTDINILKEHKINIIETGLVTILDTVNPDLIYNINRDSDIVYKR
jgi:hypothetical protein